jgi:predicted transcriptional regulator
MTFNKVVEILEADVVLDNEDDGNVEFQTVCSTDLMSDLLHFSSRPKSLLITGLANTQVVRTAEIADIKAVVFVLDKRPDKETVEMARQKEIALIVTRLSRFTACGRLYAAGLKSCTGEHR